ncbi:hypothetical protein GUJ93_ZPchr0012g22181 [Zizania palustris]|uniref:Uncharacterized protein n=1 Tax=Zizania palustris TaxID=103762 RepID=A0A8J5WN53_ZIZPA|nr:hypothetical protein GUJ93_ZPchr0012g22181 [Zizania palustris]
MDKVLASSSSVPSVSPADLAAGYWARLSWRWTTTQPPPDDGRRQQRRERSSPPRSPEERPPRFAPEFDGIDCFETIVLR